MELGLGKQIMPAALSQAYPCMQHVAPGVAEPKVRSARHGREASRTREIDCRLASLVDRIVVTPEAAAM
jgi:hypothetical protein